MAAALAVVVLVGSLTVLGLRDVPPADVETRLWGAQAIGGAEIVLRDACTRCHREGGAASSFDTMRARRDAAWIDQHAMDPEAIAPGTRTPPAGLSLQERRAVVAWARAVRSTVPAPAHDEADRRALALLGTQCLGCHVLDGDGRGNAPNLSRAGKARHAAWLAAWIADPTAFEYDTDMPAFGDKLGKDQIEAIARYLARRR
jgi:mono/diheme cytochrome c family protein